MTLSDLERTVITRYLTQYGSRSQLRQIQRLSILSATEMLLMESFFWQ